MFYIASIISYPQFYVGNTLVSDGDFSGYETLTYYAGPYGTPTTAGVGFVELPISQPKCGRYFAMQRDDGLADPILEITEVIVYTLL